jgi:hypothetical protein
MVINSSTSYKSLKSFPSHLRIYLSGYLSPSIVGVLHLKHKDSLLGPPKFTSFFIKLMTCFRFSFFFSMSNEIKFAPNFIWVFQISIVFSYECKNKKLYSSWAMFYQWPKFPKFSLFETLYIAIGHLVFVTLEHFICINN